MTPNPAAEPTAVRGARRGWPAEAFGAMALALLIAGYGYGLAAGMQRRLPEAVGRQTIALAAAISDLHFGLGGYAAYDETLRLLAPLARKTVALDDRAAVEALIARAARERPGSTGIYPLLREDKGLVSYYKLALRLFGPTLAGFYRLYFLLLGASAAAYWLAFRRRPDRLAVLVLFCAAHLLVLSAAEGTGPELWTVHNARFLPALGLLPALHLAFLALDRRSAAPGTLLGAGYQAWLLGLAIHVRGGTVMQAGFVLLAAAAAVIVHARRFPGLGPLALARVRWWPVACALGAVLALKAHLLTTLHPAHAGAPGRLLWLNFYMGLGAHPQSEARHGIVYEDTLGFRRAEDLARRNRGLGPAEEVPPALMESVLREEYLRIVRADPGFTLANYAYKAALFARNYLSAPYLGRAPLLWLGLLSAAAAAAAFAAPALTAAAGPTLGPLALSFLLSLTPTAIAMPLGYLISDSALALTTLLGGALSVAAARLAARLRQAQ